MEEGECSTPDQGRVVAKTVWDTLSPRAKCKVHTRISEKDTPKRGLNRSFRDFLNINLSRNLREVPRSSDLAKEVEAFSAETMFQDKVQI